MFSWLLLNKHPTDAYETPMSYTSFELQDSCIYA